MLNTTTRIAILCRKFPVLFKETTFDWENLQVKLGGCWIPSLAAVFGGQAPTREEVMEINGVSNKSCAAVRFDVNSPATAGYNPFPSVVEKCIRRESEEASKYQNGRACDHVTGRTTGSPPFAPDFTNNGGRSV